MVYVYSVCILSNIVYCSVCYIYNVSVYVYVCIYTLVYVCINTTTLLIYEIHSIFLDYTNYLYTTHYLYTLQAYSVEISTHTVMLTQPII